MRAMAWIEQTKKGSRKSGGPQYYLQDLSADTAIVLQSRGRCPVRLWTPYGVIDSGLEAVSRTVGKVGHDRVQSGGRVRSIADQIAVGFRLKRGDIERIEFDDSFEDGNLVILPSYVKFFRQRARRKLYPDRNPLTIVRGRHATILTEHLRASSLIRPNLPWVRAQIESIAAAHDRRAGDVDERDLLRASGALSRIGIELGMYRRKGIDCPDASFEFAGLPRYCCPVEIEERSSGFLAVHHRLHRRQRLVLLCMTHDAPETLRGHVDVLELRELARVLAEVA